MPEAVRFYWGTGTASLKEEDVPEADRDPLRIRRGVVQAHAPAVIDQLKAGRFIAAAWLDGDSLWLVLCHPNLAKGGAETILLSPTMLPRVTVKFGTWEDAPTAAGLLLKAFGSEAATPDEGAAARRDLSAWLASRAQPEKAAVTRHSSAFPFGGRSEAVDVINVWRKILVRGEKKQIDEFLAEAEVRFKGKGWSRDTDREAKMNGVEHQVSRFYCWLGGGVDEPRVLLCLNRATDKRVRGGTYDILDGRAGLPELASAVEQAVREVLEPAAAVAGIKVTYPHVGPISRVGSRTAAAMTQLVEAGDGRWPLPEGAESAWRHFVVVAFRDDTAFHPDELTRWFRQSGWDEQAASELARRFYAEATLLGEYEEEGQPAWR